MNVPKSRIAEVKTAILDKENDEENPIIVLDISDNDNGQGAADRITYTWRSKEDAPRSLGAIRSYKNSQFHKEVQDRLWIDINLTDKDALAIAVALAMAGTAPYAVASGAEIREVTGEDAGDKTGTIKQRVIKEGIPEPADYSLQDSFNPHGLQEAVMITSVREYPEVDYENVAAVFALLQTFMGTPGKGKIQVSLNGNGTFSMRALKEGTPDWSNTTPEYVQTEVQNSGAIGEAKVGLATGVPVGGAAALVAAGAADTDYALTDIQMTERGMGEAAITKRQTLKSETAVQVEESPSLGLRRAVKNYTWPIVLTSNINTVWGAALTHGVAGDYVLLYRQKNIIATGFSVTSRVVECTKKSTTYISAYEDASTTTTVECQDADEIPVILDTAGIVETIRATLNLYNKYDYIKKTTTSRVPKSCEGEVSWTTYSSYFFVTTTTFPNLGSRVYEQGYTSQLIQARWKYEHTLFFYTTAAAAASAITGGHSSSRMWKVSDNLWSATKVVRSIEYGTYYNFAAPQTEDTRVRSIYVPE